MSSIQQIIEFTLYEFEQLPTKITSLDKVFADIINSVKLSTLNIPNHEKLREIYNLLSMDNLHSIVRQKICEIIGRAGYSLVPDKTRQFEQNKAYYASIFMETLVAMEHIIINAKLMYN